MVFGLEGESLAESQFVVFLIVSALRLGGVGLSTLGRHYYPPAKSGAHQTESKE